MRLLTAFQAGIGGDAHTQRVQFDEAPGVGLVVGAAVFIEGRNVHVEQRVGFGIARNDDHITLVQLDAYPAVYGGLGVVDQGLQRNALWCPPVAVVDHRSVAWHQVILQVRYFAVQRDRFDGAVRLQHDGAARGFVAAARLHADVTVFYQIQTADAVLAAQTVQFRQYGGRRHAHAVQGDDVAAFVFDVQIFWLVRCRLRADTPAPHAFFRFGARVFQMAAFERDVQQVGVHRVRCAAVLVLHVDFDAGVFGVFQQFFARQQIPFTPWSDDLHARFQRVGTQFETHLIVTFAGGAVRDGVGAGGVGDLDQTLGDQW